MKRKVAVYARVSTEHEAQVSALENQIQYYDEYMTRFPDWELVERYIDEGLSATSTAKRVNYLRMIEDAKAGKFDLILTREVSRFARNILDAIEQTRMLKQLGVEVLFTEDGISTMNDEDGELKLSIMAILAQNESKKISTRVKAGQMISFLNGVPYGNGNILGYDRVGKEMVLNKEQAKTVRRIFDLALEGKGVRTIHFTLEKEGYKTATGLSRWQDSVILRVLRNSFYCGRIEYRKQYVPDYLEQKKINNHGEIERVITKGTHIPIVSEEEFDRVQSILASHAAVTNGIKHGVVPSRNIWVRKLKCVCGHSISRRVNYISKSGEKSYMFQCHDQLRTGTIQTRTNKGLTTEGVCESKAFAEWKLWVQADFIFRKLLSNKQEIYDKAVELLDVSINTEEKNIPDNTARIKKLNHKLKNYADMCADGDISREYYREKKKEIEMELNSIFKEEPVVQNDKERFDKLAGILKMQAFSEDIGIPEKLIDKTVSEIITDGRVFTWRFNADIAASEEFSYTVEGTKKKNMVKTMYYAPCNTGCNQRIAWNPIFLGTYNVPKRYIKEARKFYCGTIRQRVSDAMTIQIEIM